MAAGDQRTELSRRLRQLREEHWPDRSVRQGDLAKALGVSTPLISSWESQSKTPPVSRLVGYATFFATPRSLDHNPPKLLRDLTKPEKEAKDALLRELTQLRNLARTPVSATAMSRGVWHFPDDADITIVCARLPREMRAGMEYADTDSPDFSVLYTYSDPDALIELFGHLRAVNPTKNVSFRRADELVPDDLKNHLVVLGGVDWNELTRDALERMEIPVNQIARETDDEVGGFEVVEGGERHEFRATVYKIGDRTVLTEDVCHFYRSVSPYDKERTITFCNGVYSRGVLGAVRALTDINVRDKNESYIAENLGSTDTFSILAAVIILKGNIVVTPDWTADQCRLHVWEWRPQT